MSRAFCQTWGITVTFVDWGTTCQKTASGSAGSMTLMSGRTASGSRNCATCAAIPVTRGLVTEPDQWAWSSFRAYRYGESGPVRVNHWEVLDKIDFSGIAG